MIALENESYRREGEKKLARSLALLDKDPQAHDDFTLRQARSLRGSPRVEALLQQSFELRFSNIQSTKWLAYNAVRAAESLEASGRGQRKVLDLQALAWAHLANAYRITEEFSEAEAALNKSRMLLRQGSGDLELLAKIAIFEANLRTSQRRLSLAEKLLERAYLLYLQIGQPHLAGRTLLTKSSTLLYGGNPRQAVYLAQESLRLMDPKKDEKLNAVAYQCLIFSLIEAGEYTRAGTLLMSSGLRSLFAEDPIVLLKLRHTEGKLMAGIDKVSAAIRIHQEAFRGFIDYKKNYNAAMVVLSLLPLLIREGKLQEMRSLAKRAYEVFRDLGIAEEAAKARRYLL